MSVDNWTKEEADKTYNISKWGDGYFDVSPNGNLSVKPNKNGLSIEIVNVVKEMKTQGIALPAVIRFHDILRSRVKNLNSVFRSAIEEAEFEGRFFGVYPVKVNQMREVVEEIVDAGSNYDYGLEAGSKPELLAALAYNTNLNSLTICNGYKDEDFLRLALLGTKLGRKFIIVVEKFSELKKIISLSKEMNVVPMIGFRARMSIEGHGRWAHSSGEKAKFGLSTAEMLTAIEHLEENNLKDSVKLFHFHIGSQVSDIRTIKEAINEGGRIYSKLMKLGLKIDYFDAGGGLGVDYDGSKSSSDSSINYSIEEYASDIVWGLKQICDLEGVPHPNIVTESGRAITAHHSCVITNVIDSIHTGTSGYNTRKIAGEHHLVDDMRELLTLLTPANFQEIYNEALQVKDQSLNAFKLGIFSLEERAKIETLYWEVTKNIRDILQNLDYIPEELSDLESDLSPQYLCNFSVFQSAADTWAIRQILPVVPITRLNEKPTVNCSIADITCDSDGKIDNFMHVLDEGPQDSIPLHEINGEEYLIGLFLTGAYQDVMGDMHNLFGRLNEVHVFSDPDDKLGFYIEEAIKGNSASAVLSTMQYNTEYMAQKIKKMVNKEVSRGRIIPRIGVKLADFYEDCLESYTYLNDSKTSLL